MCVASIHRGMPYDPGMRALAVLAAAVAGLALAGSALAAAPLTVAFKPLAAGPKINVKWPYRITVTQAGKPVNAVITATLIDPIAQEHQVMDARNKPLKARAAKGGVLLEKILFPPESKGFSLTLRFTVKAGGAKKVAEVVVTPR
jgi:hypothetical protein